MSAVASGTRKKVRGTHPTLPTLQFTHPTLALGGYNLPILRELTPLYCYKNCFSQVGRVSDSVTRRCGFVGLRCQKTHLTRPT